MGKLFSDWSKTKIQEVIQDGLKGEVFDILGVNDFENGDGVVIVVVSGEKAAAVYEATKSIKDDGLDYE